MLSTDMWTKRLASLFVLFWIVGGAVASSQTVFANGGGAFYGSNARDLGARASTQVGVQLWYTDLLRLRGALSFHGLNALEGGLEVHPFNRNSLDFSFDPYAFAGFGRYLSGNRNEQVVVPTGIGADYPLSRRVNLTMQLAARWVLASSQDRSVDVIPAIAPSIGLSFDLGLWGDRPAPGQPALFAARGTRREEAREEENERVPEAAAPEEEVASNERASANEKSAVAERAADREPTRRPEDVIAKKAPMPAGTARRSGGPARRAPAPPDTTEGVKSKNQMRNVPAGSFVMGLTDEDPLDLQQAGRKRVTVTPFKIDKFEVSNVDYRAFLKSLSPQQRSEMMPDSSIWEQARSRSTWSTYFNGAEYADYPVVGVTREQAQQFCKFYDKRLPTEAEWEYAARGSLVGSIYPWQGYEPRNSRGNYLANYNPDRGGYAADGYAFTAPGDAYPPSSWGLYNMSGNVAEWVQDAYQPSYSELSDFNPLYEEPDAKRYVVRGGSWASNAFYIGVGVRDSQPPDKPSPYIGFRCASDAGGAE